MTSRADWQGVPSAGRTMPRADAHTKVTGSERYAADCYGSNFLWAGVKRAGVASGRLRAIHASAVGKLPGVVRVLTWRDIPGEKKIGLIRKDQPVLAESRIRHAGEPIALVLTESRSALAAALGAITFDWEPLPAVFDIEAALAPGAPLLHDGMPEGNLVRLVTVDKGEGQAGFQECDAVVEAVFDVPSQEHAYLETEAGFAAVDERGRLVITASTQTPFRDRLEIAPVLGLDPESIRVIAPFLGGGFGGKDGITVQALLGLAVLHSGGRPVKMWWDREESFLAGVKRMAARMYYRLGAKRTGELHALSCRLYYDSGAYAGLCGEIMTLGVEHAGSAYRIPHVHIEGRCVSTNNTPGGPFRGFGVPQVTAAMEQMIDLLARRLSTDPLTIRERNGLRQGDSNCVGLTLPYSTGVLDCLAAVRKHPLWQGREAWKGRAGMFRKRGVGLACMAHAMGYPPIVPDVGLARIGLTEEGRVRVFAGVADMGQGNASTCLQIAGVILNQPAGAMDLVLPDTDKTLPSGSASASRCTFVYGNALVGAATELKRRVLEKARTLAGATSGDGLELLAGKVREKATDNDIPLADIARLMDENERVCEGRYQAPTAREKLEAIYMGPHVLFSYGAHLIYVEVDTLTGNVEVKEYLAATDAGTVLNPQLYEQQIQGAVAQGLGYALCETFRTPNGAAGTRNLSTYVIPTALDIPDITSVPVELGEAEGPFGLKGVGEIALSGAAPAVANALADACEVRPFRLPLTGETVLLAMRAAPGEKEGGP